MVHTLKFRIGSGEATPGGVLAPVLAPYGIDLMKFSRELNSLLLAEYAQGVPVAVVVLVELSNYRILVGHPPLTVLLHAISHPVGMVDLYNLFRLHLQNRQVELSVSEARTFFGSLRSYHQWDFQTV